MTGGVHHAHIAGEVLARLRARRPRVQCLTNTVAQAITANVLHALGAGASMATHPDEVVEMSLTADALLVNLGTLDAARVAAIRLLAATDDVGQVPVTLDPVFVQHSALRRDLAARVLAAQPRVVKGNAAEIAALGGFADLDRRQPGAIVTTGPVDRIVGGGLTREVRLGHPWMASVTGLGCALGAVVAACTAVESDAVAAATAAVVIFGGAGTRAGRAARGPGSFAVAFLDALSELDQRMLSESMA